MREEASGGAAPTATVRGARSSELEPGVPAPSGTIPLSVPHLGGREWEYVRECLDTNWVSSAGRFVERFEGAVAAGVGAEHAVATVNGTAALHVALRAVGVERDDEVLVSALSFIAPANAIRYQGAWPVFVDAEPSTWQMDAHRVEAFLEDGCRRTGRGVLNRRTGRRIRAILPVHVLGIPVDMDPLMELARVYGLAVVEDATESLGATYRGRSVGTLGDAACFSFNGNKLITTGGGGMVVTDDAETAARIRYLTTQAKDDPVEYVHREVGYNYRLTNVQAALGCAQMERLDEHVRAKREIAARYREGLEGLPGITPMPEPADTESAFWLYTVRVDGQRFGASSRELMRELREEGVQSRPLWQPLHRSPAHSDAGTFHCPVAESLHREALSLPSSVGLAAEQQRRVIDIVRRAAAG